MVLDIMKKKRVENCECLVYTHATGVCVTNSANLCHKVSTTAAVSATTIPLGLCQNQIRLTGFNCFQPRDLNFTLRFSDCKINARESSELSNSH